MKKVCTVCRVSKAIKDFHPRKGRKTPGWRPACKDCTRALGRSDTHKRGTAKYRESLKGRCVTALCGSNTVAALRGYVPCSASVETLSEAFTAVCHCCGKPEKSNGRKRLSLDHCHTTGKFRGWLCTQCNIALGMINDKPELLIHYLKRVSK